MRGEESFKIAEKARKKIAKLRDKALFEYLKTQSNFLKSSGYFRGVFPGEFSIAETSLEIELRTKKIKKDKQQEFINRNFFDVDFMLDLRKEYDWGGIKKDRCSGSLKVFAEYGVKEGNRILEACIH